MEASHCLREMQRLAAEQMQERSNFLCGWGRKPKYWLDVNIRKTQSRETRTERLSDVFGGGVRHFH